jgi:uncharacterized protein (DUF3820 family)
MMFRNFLQNRVNCNPETRHTRSLHGNLPDDGHVFTPVEEKLIRLGLDPAAHQGEVDACAVKLFGSLRRRGTRAEQILQSFATATWAARELSAARGYVVNFGKYRGRTVGELPIGYLKWALRTCDNMPHNLRRAMQIVLNH